MKYAGYSNENIDDGALTKPNTVDKENYKSKFSKRTVVKIDDSLFDTSKFSEFESSWDAINKVSSIRPNRSRFSIKK